MSETQKCGHCSEARDSLLKCSACGSVGYCNQSCQKADWKNHKKVCRCFKIEALSGKGFGMVAVRKIKQGEIILTENPLMVLSKNKVNKNKGPSLLEQFENLSKPNQAKVLKLHHENPEADLEAKLENIFESNTIEVAPANCVALYPTIPRY